jgi:hypothetical protein
VEVVGSSAVPCVIWVRGGCSLLRRAAHHHLWIYRHARALDVCVSGGVTGVLYLLPVGRDVAKYGLTIAFPESTGCSDSVTGLSKQQLDLLSHRNSKPIPAVQHYLN